jgi:flagellar protein FlgJ
MIPSSDLSGKFALDVSGVEALKREARTDPDKALRSAAQQFEALLMQMMLKSMREAADVGASTDSQDGKLYKSMLDQQLSIALAKRGLGLADTMVQQLSRGGSTQAADPSATDPAEAPAPAGEPFAPRARATPAAIPGAAPGMSLAPVATAPAGVASADLPQTARDFIGRLWPHALEASRATGIAPHFILGQAALESGWGRGEIRMPDGNSSHNLFGIKAGRGWQGAVADVATTEYVNGAPIKTMERFRAYGSYAEAFKDYANLLAANPRYAHVLNERVDAAAFARGLQQAGYATDPNYADKLTRVITGAIMRNGLGG